MNPRKRSFPVLALPLALALSATQASAGQAKNQTSAPSKPAQIKVDSPNMATSISDWHTELGTAPQRTATAAGCTCACAKTHAQPATNEAPRAAATASAPSGRTVTQTATNVEPASQRGGRGKGSANPSERAREIPLRSIRQ